MTEPEIAIAASPRDWAGRLHRHTSDHGGARVRATVLHPHEALTERYDVLVVDDTTSYLTARLVTDLHQRDRRVLGVYDEDDPAGKGELLALGVDDVIGRRARTEELVDAIAALAAFTVRDELDEVVDLDPRNAAWTAAFPDVDAEPSAETGTVVAVGAASGGCGATEVAIAIAGGHAAGVLVDADATVPSIAQRLGLPPYPNLSVAIDAVEHHHTPLAETLSPLPGGGAVLPGCEPRQGVDVRPTEAAGVVTALAAAHPVVVVDVGARLDGDPVEPSASAGQGAAVVAAADTVIAVTLPTPVGVARLLDWLADVRALAPLAPVHVVVNRAPSSAYKRAEVAAEVRRNVQTESLVFVPADPRVESAAWAGELVGPGPFTRALRPLTARVTPPTAPVAVGRRGRWRR